MVPMPANSYDGAFREILRDGAGACLYHLPTDRQPQIGLRDNNDDNFHYDD